MRTSQRSTAHHNTSSNLAADLLFIARYTPKALFTISLYSLAGAIAGWSSCHIFREAWTNFAHDYHSIIDPQQTYVAQDEEYMRFSRLQQFNKVTPAIGEAIPAYASLVGACTAGFFAAKKVMGDFNPQLAEDRIVRHLNIV